MSGSRGVATIFALSLVFPAVVSAQERRGGRGPLSYDLPHEVVVTGTMGATETMSAGPQPMLLLKVTLKDGPVQLILAPPDWVKKQKFVFTPGASVEVTGVPGYHVNGEPAMFVRKLKSGTQTLTLRDATGKPEWLEPSDQR